jgi:hypothetical protein
MLPVTSAVRDVVDEIDDARQCAEHGERLEGFDDRPPVEQTAAEEEAREDQQVLGPLAWTQGSEKMQNDRTPRYRRD